MKNANDMKSYEIKKNGKTFSCMNITWTMNGKVKVDGKACGSVKAGWTNCPDGSFDMSITETDPRGWYFYNARFQEMSFEAFVDKYGK